MNPVRVNDSIEVHNLTELAELCKVAGAAGTTVISSCDKVIVYFKDFHTNELQAGDFVDELHIRHHKNACVLIAVFIEDGMR